MAQYAQPRHEKWVETAEALIFNAPSQVSCPCCGSTTLSVRDVEYGFGHEKGIQRYISCDCCGAFTGVNLKRAGKKQHDILHAAE